MPVEIVTERLTLNSLEPSASAFILELLNSPGWLQFIGDRNITNIADADAYINRIRTSPFIRYWVVKLKAAEAPIGIVTYIKRDFFDHHDLGFAFLPAHEGEGYAFEAAKAVLQYLAANTTETQVLATTNVDNYRSVHLLEKLGFMLEREIEIEKRRLKLYSVTIAL